MRVSKRQFHIDCKAVSTMKSITTTDIRWTETICLTTLLVCTWTVSMDNFDRHTNGVTEDTVHDTSAAF
jgi:hypothetical protein